MAAVISTGNLNWVPPHCGCMNDKYPSQKYSGGSSTTYPWKEPYTCINSTTDFEDAGK